MNVCADKVWGTFLSLFFSLHRTVEGGAAPPSVLCNTTQVYGFTGWEKQGSLLGTTGTVQMYRCEVVVPKGALLLLKALGKEMLPRWCGQMKQALLSTAQLQCRSQGMWISAQAHKPCSNLLPMQFYSFYLGVGSQLCIKTAECCATEACPEGQLWYSSTALQRDAAAPMSRGPGGLGIIHWHDESGAGAAWKLWHNLSAKTQPSGQRCQAAAIPKVKLALWPLCQQWPSFSRCEHTLARGLRVAASLNRQLLQSEPQHKTPHPPCACQFLPCPFVLRGGHSCFSPPQTLSRADCRVCTRRDGDDTAPYLTLTMAWLSEHPALTHPLAHTTLQQCSVHSLALAVKTGFWWAMTSSQLIADTLNCINIQRCLSMWQSTYSLMPSGHWDPDGTRSYAGQMQPESSGMAYPWEMWTGVGLCHQHWN